METPPSTGSKKEASTMNVYTIADFEGHTPAGSAAVVIARDKGHARRLLNADLEQRGLPELGAHETFDKLDLNVARSLVLNDGIY